jgi:hypothetical protein
VFAFMGGSMGSVVGERITRLFERAALSRFPSCSFTRRAARACKRASSRSCKWRRPSAALGRFRGTRRPYISVLVHPTTGGVAASTALLGDVNIAEPGALIGFAGPRVIESTLANHLPEGFQRSEFLVRHGMVDSIVPRPELRSALASCSPTSEAPHDAISPRRSDDSTRSFRAARSSGSNGIQAACQRFGNPEQAFQAIHIAGTNGKGHGLRVHRLDGTRRRPPRRHVHARRT